MKRRHNFLAYLAAGATALALLFVAFSFAACGDLPEKEDVPITGTVIIPGFIKVGEEATASVTVSNVKGGSSFKYSWRIDESEEGTFSSSINSSENFKPIASDVGKYLQVWVGATTGYSGYIKSNKVQVRAASVEKPEILSVAISPKPVTIKAGNDQQFTATINGNYSNGAGLNENDKKVLWSISGTGIIDGTTISEKGVLTIAEDQPAATITVKAISTIYAIFATAKMDTATVTVTPVPRLTGTVTIPSVISIGDKITANISALDATGSISYQWERFQSEDGDSMDIPEATSGTYTVNSNHVAAGQYIRVRVRCSEKSGYVYSNMVCVQE